MKKAAKDIKTSLSYWGISNIKTYTYQSQATSLKEISEDRKRNIDKDLDILVNKIQKEGEVKVSLKSKAMFMMMRLMQKKGLGACVKDTEYWKEQGWLESKRPWNE